MYGKAAWLTIFIALSTACSDDVTNKRDSSQPNTGDATSTTPGSSSSDTSDPTLATGDAQTVALFEEMVHPLLALRCGTCHAESVAPKFAGGDPVASYSELIANGKVEFGDTNRSRLVLRLASDNHNCWSECEEDAEEMNKALAEWIGAIGTSGDTLAGKAITPELTLADISFPENPNPNSQYAFEAERGKRTGAFATADNALASAGEVITSLSGGTDENDPAEAFANEELGNLRYDFFIEQEGLYMIQVRTKSSESGARGFFVRLDDFDPRRATAVRNEEFMWTRLQGYDEEQPTMTFLAQGAHTLEIRQRERGVQFDRIAITTSADVPVDFLKDSPLLPRTLRFSLDGLLGKPGAWFVVGVDDYSETAYKFTQPRIESEIGPIRVRGIVPLVNGAFLNQHATYSRIDAVSENATLSEAAMIVLKDPATDIDKLSFAFEVLETVTSD